MAEAVRVKYGGKEYEFVRSEEVYEIVNGKKKRVRDNGNALLRLAGHTVKSAKITVAAREALTPAVIGTNL